MKTDARGQPATNAQSKEVTVWEANCRLRDLRHSYASILASAGLSLPVIGALLGHTRAATTQRYAHLLDGAWRAATEQVGAAFDAGGGNGVQVKAGKAG